MSALRRTTRVIGTVGVETATVAALVLLGRRPELAVPVRHLGRWLREGDPATVVVALLRWVALLGAGWLLASTLVYLAAALSRVPAAVRAVEWSTLPTVRRAVDAACAVSVVTAVVLAPASANAAAGSRDTTTVTLVRDGRSGQRGIAQLPPDSTPASASPASPVVQPDEVVVATGDDLWELSARQLALVSARGRGDVSDAEVAPYWARVCDANRGRLASGDANLVYPGERIVLPPSP